MLPEAKNYGMKLGRSAVGLATTKSERGVKGGVARPFRSPLPKPGANCNFVQYVVLPVPSDSENVHSSKRVPTVGINCRR